MWRVLLAEHGGGVPYNQVYDVRGNHDTFDSGSRCGPRDYYCTYSARAAAAAAASTGTAAAVSYRGFGDRVAAGPMGRFFLDEVYDTANGGVAHDTATEAGGRGVSGGGSAGVVHGMARQQMEEGLSGQEQQQRQDPHADGELGAGHGGGHGGGRAGRCPVAVLAGLDASLAPGVRSPLNFLGE